MNEAVVMKREKELTTAPSRDSGVYRALTEGERGYGVGLNDPELDRLVENGPSKLAETARTCAKRIARREITAEQAKLLLAGDINTYFDQVEAGVNETDTKAHVLPNMTEY